MPSSYNPINSVDGKAVKCPSSYTYSLDDLSASDAGRTEDTTMHTLRQAQLVTLDLSWQNLTTEEVSSILKAFSPEYVKVSYLDAKAGGYVTSSFYVGSRSAPMYNSLLGLWSDVSFQITQRTGG